MQYREDKRSGKQLSALGFGCMRLPSGMGRIDREKSEALLLDAFERGVNYYDTAYLYYGSEEVTGEIFEKHGIREKVYIATKLPQALCGRFSDFERFFGIQKQRLRTGYIDYYLMHNFSDFSEWQKLCALGIRDWIAAKKKSGEIRQIGFSFHGAYPDFVKLIDDYDWDFTQIQYNYMNTNYQAGIDGLRYAAGKGLPVIIMEPLLGGKLANLSAQANAILKNAHPDSTAPGLALRFVWDAPEVTLLLSGMNTPAQLEENTRLAETAPPGCLTESERHTIQEIKTIFGKSYKIPCTGCNYCMPCPVKINIPAFFEAYNLSFAINRAAGISSYILSSGAFSGFPHYAGDCVECGKCAGHCPQRIEIPTQLKIVKRRLQIPGMKGLASFVIKHIVKR